jgi:flagellar hook assembly protein FlgD
VRTLVDEVQDAGDHVVHWEGRDADNRVVSLGVYYVALAFSEENRTRKIVLTN